MNNPPMHQPVIVTDGGPWAMLHDMACPVCQEFKAILNLNTGVFMPCGRCEAQGWVTRRKRWRR